MTNINSAADRIARCRAGDPAAIEWLVRNHQAAVYRLALSILDDPDEADEATQETFLAALRRLDGFRGDATLTTWLTAIAVNVSRDRLRRHQARQRLRRTLAGLGLAAQESPAAGLPHEEPLPEAAAMRRESDEALWAAVQALGEKHRLVVILRYYHDMPTSEIARVLGLSEGTIHSRLSTARERLRATLQTDPATRPDVRKL
jgi:RNA polymerase sigma-70 factor, ECF subfamily